jgi:hypothetical protein
MRRAPRLARNRDDVVGELGRQVDALGGFLQRPHLSHGQDRVQAGQGVLGTPGRLEEDAPLVFGRRVVDANAQEETIHLRLGQRIGAVALLGILRRHHQKRRVQRVRPAVDRHLALVHRFEQRALCARRRSVDLVGENQVREHGPGAELEFARLRIEDRDADHVRWQQVARKLDAMEGTADGPRQGPRQRRLADARDILDQEVAAREQGDHGVADGARLPAKHARDVGFQRRDELCRRGEPLAGHGCGAHELCNYNTTEHHLRQGWLRYAKTSILGTL